MRIEHLDVRCFGPLRGRSYHLAQGVTLFVGPNEAGKSSLVAAIETALFGFRTRTLEVAAIATGSTPEELELLAELYSQKGERSVVRRTLGPEPLTPVRSRSRGALGACAAIPDLACYARELFTSLCTIGPDSEVELARAARETLERILAGDPAAAGSQSVTEWRKALSEEAKKLWREDQRGKPKALELRTELAAARAALAAAQERERGLRAVAQERAELRDRMGPLQARRSALLAEKAELGLLAELACLELEQRALGREAQALAMDIESPEALEERMRALEVRVAEPRARLAQAAVRLSERELLVLERAGQIDRAAAEGTRHAHELELLEQVHSEARILEREASVLATALLGRTPTRSEMAWLARLPLDVLEAGRERSLEQQEHSSRPGVPTLAWVLCALGLCGLALAYQASLLSLPQVLAGGLCWLAAIAIWVRRIASPAHAKLPEEFASLATLRLDPALLASPAARSRTLERLRSVVAVLHSAEAERERAAHLAAALEEREESWCVLCRELGLEESDSGTLALSALKEALQSARAQAEFVERDALEREHAHLALESNDYDLEQARVELTRIDGLLRKVALGENDRKRAYAIFQAKRSDYEFAQRRRATIASDQRTRSLLQDQRFEQALADPLAWRERSEVQIAAEIQRLDEELAAAHRRAGEIDEQLRQDPGSAVARACERIDQLEEALQELALRRDRLLVLEALLAEAQRRFREAHGQDILVHASAWLARLTHDEWQRLEWLAETEHPLHVARSPGSPSVPVAPPLSRGLRDQIQLCLRLGLLEHFEAGRESLPMLLDEAFVHWDEGRRLAFYPILRELAARRQVLIFTCHDFLAREIERAFGLRRVLVEAPAPGGTRRRGERDVSHQEA